MDFEFTKRMSNGSYWLTNEGREKIRKLWDDEKDSIPIVLLNRVEQLESVIKRLERKNKNLISMYVSLDERGD